MEGYTLHQNHPGFAPDLTSLEDHIHMENKPLTKNPHYHENKCFHMNDTSNGNLDHCTTANII